MAKRFEEPDPKLYEESDDDRLTHAEELLLRGRFQQDVVPRTHHQAKRQDLTNEKPMRLIKFLLGIVESSPWEGTPAEDECERLVWRERYRRMCCMCDASPPGKHWPHREYRMLGRNLETVPVAFCPKCWADYEREHDDIIRTREQCAKVRCEMLQRTKILTDGKKLGKTIENIWEASG